MANLDAVPFVIKSKDVTVVDDAYLLAALLTLAPQITYVPRRDASGHVSFEVHGRIADEMGRLYAGAPASLKTYITNLKALRAKIFAFKGAEPMAEKMASSPEEIGG